eukprot:TRINITY_DN50462_c0_g1_i1.p1 TRINITY_DN50462_c0_g1~~TRINITY_DN50462_c0_g1_i1.p1  ORF type:complete len:235 (-),score=57.87 TRINITY_DN50462_c0_g1_i1:166-834(-)
MGRQQWRRKEEVDKNNISECEPKGRKYWQPKDARFNDKAYKDGIRELEQNSCVRFEDLDHLAISYLDYLEETDGRAVDALKYLLNAVKDLARDKVLKWKEYLWKILKAFDVDAHKKLKELREAKKAEQRKARWDSSTQYTQVSFNVDAPVFVPMKEKMRECIHGAIEEGEMQRRAVKAIEERAELALKRAGQSPAQIASAGRHMLIAAFPPREDVGKNVQKN